MNDSIEIIKEDTFTDKSKWARGEWDNEPDKIHFVDKETGYDCLIVRNPVGALCGYVAVEEGHPAFQKEYEDVDVHVHGGLTFSGPCHEKEKERGVCHTPREGRPDKVWWLGFDCAHWQDFAPGITLAFKERSDWDIYRNVAFVVREIQDLAKQLKKMT